MPARRHYRGQSEKTRLDRVLARFGQTRLGGVLFITVFPAIDKRLMPLTGRQAADRPGSADAAAARSRREDRRAAA